ncbi:MAG: histone deacetylase [Heterodermia speciosa]|uniref:Histone deacetylase n=1 Tax=Heterodermia speciosa TaxID=116794 RepID=A0A8H3G2Z4_9LECA|nr:MAG: histone deacetylase [Heterodermia speciosa]
MTVVREYEHPQPGATSTFSLDEKSQHQILTGGIQRPKGKTVSYHSNPIVEAQHFGPHHPMKPWRLTLTNKIVLGYGMHHAMDMYLSKPATREELTDFHSEDYVDFLKSVTEAGEPLQPDKETGLYAHNMGDDCPFFDGLFDYCSLYSGASLDAARKLTNNQADIAINWSGGLHHAKKSEASGFCYINDIVLAILQLLLYYPRVLYIDIDVHHGDGVEQAFWSTDRVMTVSFHKYDKAIFFPGTGGVDEVGPPENTNPGAHHSLNVPLHDGIDDESYTNLFKDIIGPCVERYNPSTIVLQCGADSLGGDRLGCFNLNIKAHGECVKFVKSFNTPLLVLGGGGYTARNVARLWAHETSVCLDAEVSNTLPRDMPFLSHFPEGTLYPDLSRGGRFTNINTPQYLRGLVQSTLEQLRYFVHSPSVQMKYMPPDLDVVRRDVEEEVREIREKESRNGLNGRGRRERERGAGVRGERYC